MILGVLGLFGLLLKGVLKGVRLNQLGVTLLLVTETSDMSGPPARVTLLTETSEVPGPAWREVITIVIYTQVESA